MNKCFSLMMVAVLLISIATPGLSKPKPEPNPILPLIAAGAGLGSLAVGAGALGVSASGCQLNCHLNDWKARDRKCGGSGGAYSYAGPVHGTCYCCRE